ncbi:MAG: sensor domain-containing diguanylate cyclase [Chromatiales bacterium]
MKSPEHPKDEPARLQTLQSLNILDTPPEERFDRLTRMAKRLFDVPIALVSLVDNDRQWFKSCIGLSARETPRDISFCGHAILGNDLLIVQNALDDERFADNPLVTSDPYIRFYAGCPLRAHNGQKLGTLCIIDQKPRSFDKDDLESLVDLASMVERELAAVQLASVDELTNISNRRGFLQLAQHSLNLFTREMIPASLVFIDLDNFKPINDTYGHAEGDRVLSAFAQQLESTFRNSDIVARLGGDEFVVLLTNSNKWKAENIVQRFRETISTINQKSIIGHAISFSYGIVEFNPQKHRNIEALLAEGDSLMYETKQARRYCN